MTTDLRALVRADDRDAFAQLFDRYARAVYNHGFPLTADWALADDVASATFLQAWRLYDVTLVEVRCSKVELDRRERVRGDRPVGLARSQAAVYAHGEFDIVVDTTSTSASTSHRTHTR